MSPDEPSRAAAECPRMNSEEPLSTLDWLSSGFPMNPTHPPPSAPGIPRRSFGRYTPRPFYPRPLHPRAGTPLAGAKPGQERQPAEGGTGLLLDCRAASHLP